MDIINQAKLDDLYGCNDTATDIIHMFIDKSEQLLEEIEAAIDTQDTELLARICHKGIGQSRYIAAPMLEETLIDLQKAPKEEKSKHLNILKTMVSQITHAYS